MKKKKMLMIIIDNLFWMLIMIIPVMVLFITKQDFSVVLAQFGINDSNVIYTTLVEIFGASGLFPLFKDNSPFLLYFTFLVVVELMHLFVDFLVFIPRIAHKWFDSFTRTEDVL